MTMPSDLCLILKPSALMLAILANIQQENPNASECEILADLRHHTEVLHSIRTPCGVSTKCKLEHLRKGSFILALESGRHTDLETGHTYRNFSVSRPEGARIRYIREAQLTENYRPVVPETVRDWWTEEHAAIPDVQTSELHVISGAITPLWQRLKTTEASEGAILAGGSDNDTADRRTDYQ
jgi:hypothetical protein